MFVHLYLKTEQCKITIDTFAFIDPPEIHIVRKLTEMNSHTCIMQTVDWSLREFRGVLMKPMKGIKSLYFMIITYFMSNR